MTVLLTRPQLNEGEALREFEIPRKQWTIAECRDMVNRGVWDGSEYELINGDLVPKMAENEPHAFCCAQMQDALGDVFGRLHVRYASPISLSQTSAPEPDVCVTTLPRSAFLASGAPIPEQIRLAIEVSNTTLASDLGFKARLYALAGIPEYVVLDIGNRRLHVHRDPQNGVYATVLVLNDTDVFTLLAAPEAAIPVAGLLPPSAVAGATAMAVPVRDADSTNANPS